MAKPEAGTKRECPETGKKFYDLNNDPITSPYTGMTYPKSFFEELNAPEPAKDEKVDKSEAATETTDDDDDDILSTDDAEIVSLEDADADAAGADVGVPGIEDEEDIEIADGADDNTFLETDDDDDDVSDLIVDTNDDDKDI